VVVPGKCNVKLWRIGHILKFRRKGSVVNTIPSVYKLCNLFSGEIIIKSLLFHWQIECQWLDIVPDKDGVNDGDGEGWDRHRRRSTQPDDALQN
jgi:hypothetical protein